MAPPDEGTAEHRDLVALHKHWVTADAVDHHLRRSIGRDQPGGDGLPQALADAAQRFSALAVVAVWYALLQVVVEGYRELGLRDPGVDALLADGDHAHGLRRFRNAMFHYQSDPLSPKLLDFLLAADGEMWIRRLNAAFRSMFEDGLRIRSRIDAATMGSGFDDVDPIEP